MDFKPSDFSLSPRDLLTIVVPGAVVSFALSPAYSVVFGRSRLFPDPVGTLGSVAAFLIAAYVLGHLLDAVASALLDPLYDRTYRNLKRLPSDEQGTTKESEQLPRKPFRMAKDLFRRARKSFRLTRKRLRLAWALTDTAGVDPLLEAARSVHTSLLEKRGLGALAKAKKSPSILDWAQSAVVLHASDGAREVEAPQAASKLFRSMSLVVVLVPLFGLMRLPFMPDRDLNNSLLMLAAFVAGLVVSVALAYRFMKLRWTATQRTYEYYIVWQTTPPVASRAH